MASSRQPSKALDLDITIISAKHLKNVNWRRGDLKPYVVFWLDPNCRIVTKPDVDGSTRPVWNERFTLPITAPLHDSLLTLDLFHSKPSDTPKPLIGTLTSRLADLISDADGKPAPIRSLQLLRPSGRPQGKIRIKLSLADRLPMPPPPPPSYHPPPPRARYYASGAPPNPEFSDYFHSYAAHPPPSTPPGLPYHHSTYPDSYPYVGGYYSGYAAPQQAPPPPQPFFNRPGSSYGLHSGPSAPVDYSSYDQRKKGSSRAGDLGTGLAVGAVAGALGGLALEEGIKYEEEKIDETAGSDIVGRDDYTSYRSDY